MKPYYEADGIAIYHGDCREIRTWCRADVLVTDPPYGMGYRSGRTGRSISNDSDTTTRDEALLLWGGRPALVFGRWDCPLPQGAKMALTWDKDMWGMGDLKLPWGLSTETIYVIGGGFRGKRQGSVVRVMRYMTTDLHPNEKPVSLLELLLCKCPLGTVADPFMGSGTTLVAAKNLRRKAIGIEIEERYCEIAAERLSQTVMDFGPGRPAPTHEISDLLPTKGEAAV